MFVIAINGGACIQVVCYDFPPASDIRSQFETKELETMAPKKIQGMTQEEAGLVDEVTVNADPIRLTDLGCFSQRRLGHSL